jgi:hypothetical protein
MFLQKFELSCTIAVHVPGILNTVDVLAPKITLGETTPVKLGARKV